MGFFSYLKAAHIVLTSGRLTTTRIFLVVGASFYCEKFYLLESSTHSYNRLTAVYSVLVSWIARKCNNEINFPITTPSYTHMRAASHNTTMAVDGAKDRRDMQ
ncbi:hypothetical protein N8602_00230 [bacterium]|nr:hypothetical protein [bacterium]